LGVPDFDFFSVFFARCNTRLKCRLIDLLGRLSDRRYSSFLAAALEKEFFTVRARAARALGELGDRAVVGPLVRAQREDPSEEVQREAALALRKLDARK
jgi:HEAT repeat protein